MNKPALSSIKAVFILFLIDVGLAVPLALSTPGGNETVQPLIFFIAIFVSIYTYIKYKQYIYLGFVLTNMYGATSISIADLAKNTSSTQYDTLKNITKIIKNKMFPGMSYDSLTDAIYISVSGTKHIRHFNLNVEPKKLKSKLFLLFTCNCLISAFMGSAYASEKDESAIIVMCILAVILLSTYVIISNHFSALHYAALTIGQVRVPIDNGNMARVISNLINSSYLNNVLISDDLTYFTFYPPVLEQIEGNIPQKSIPKKTEQQTIPEKNIDSENKENIYRGFDYVNEIRKINDDLPDKEISLKLEKFEDITKQIFTFVEAHPTKSSDIRKILQYHLPTMIKLLNTYKEINQIDSKSMNIQTIKNDILKGLDQIILAFSNILDKLLENVKWDVASEISALQNMLEQDGLTDRDPFNLRTKKD